ncbi:hypothetical protein TSUD_07870 [Trifolium subterraneum]|uniref:Helicase C-terminal domain-containing protein n=1 Tax=Trifolium subterraneum TaxID=3900 RepID=A0A2Z6LKJ4_TRISU|nr:hypothetical protein TSUD_07870 [Trifolium subterraneum]
MSDPFQNNLDELFMLMHFLDAGKFGILEEFQEEFKDINQEQQISRLHKLLAPHLLRRVKKDVMTKLPPKKELIVRVELSSKQRKYYKAILTRNYDVLTGHGGAQISLNNVVMELRKLCCHPYMLEGVEPIMAEEKEVNKQLVESSGKLQLLDKLMVKLKEQGHRVLIYSQFQKMLDMLEDYCVYKHWQYERIDGKVGGAERQVRIDRFNEKNSSKFCFLLSTRAAGVGINLATADTVILYDSDWNPHADLQAMARAHRLGQTNKVLIYRLITRGTIEERMIEIAKKKMVLEHLVVGGMKGQNINQEELDDIIRYGSKELFADENDAVGKSRQIHYDDAAIDRLLDRDQVGDEEATLDDENENGFLKAFKGREAAENCWYATVNMVSFKVRGFTHLDDLSSDEEDENYEVNLTSKSHSKKKAQIADNSNPLPLMEGEGNSLKVLGFNLSQRNTFLQILMRFGVGDFDWKEFAPRIRQKTWHEINAYGNLFMSHIAEEINDSPTFSDGVPKEGLQIEDVLVRIAVLLSIREKVKFASENPGTPLFSDDILSHYTGLKVRKAWKQEHDLVLLRAVLKHGYGKWAAIVDDEDLNIRMVICQELNIPFINLPVCGQVGSQAKNGANMTNMESTSNQSTENSVNVMEVNGEQGSCVAGYQEKLDQFKNMQRRQTEFIKKRFLLLEKFLNDESAKEYHDNISAKEGMNQ